MVGTPVSTRPAQHRVGPAPSSNIATAARAFGDDYPLSVTQWPVRLAAVVLIAASVVYAGWAVGALNTDALWLAVPFAAANLYSLLYSVVVVVNQWSRRVPERRLAPHGGEPLVGVIIPTCGEPTGMILRTVESVLDQDWPAHRMAIVVSDDGHSDELRRALEPYPVNYHSPPPRDAPGRDGAAKAGNLNSALAELLRTHPDVAYVETRDADDEVGSHGFLRHCVGQLLADDALAFVQTIKEAQVSAGDPFNNRESMFYRGQMLTRNAANAVFPCGSGVVWRRTALHEIGDFPTWNLVEDLQSGVEALRRGWRGLYVPIVGAVGQHAPEDLSNAYKQRGTWAIDTVRLMLWGDLRGLGWRQRSHFYGMVLDYFNAFASLVYVPAIALALLGITPFDTDGWSYVVFMGPLVLTTEAWLLVINRPFNDRRRKQRHPYRALWRARVIWTGMAPVYIKASVQAIFGGRNRKPTYKVTRKQDQFEWYWQLTVPQAFAVTAVLACAVYSVLYGRLPPLAVLGATTYWGGMHLVLFGKFVTYGWRGVSIGQRRDLAGAARDVEGAMRDATGERRIS